MPASNAASQGVSSSAHFGRWSVGVLSPHPVVVPAPSGTVESNPYFLPKYTRAADSTP